MNTFVPPVRNWLRAEGLAVLLLSVFGYWHSGSNGWIFVLLLLTPDVSMLPYLLNPRLGAVSYNLAHNYVLPLSLILFFFALHRERAMPYLLIWTAHIGLDRTLGYGLKYPSGFKATHLGMLNP